MLLGCRFAFLLGFGWFCWGQLGPRPRFLSTCRSESSGRWPARSRSSRFPSLWFSFVMSRFLYLWSPTRWCCWSCLAPLFCPLGDDPVWAGGSPPYRHFGHGCSCWSCVSPTIFHGLVLPSWLSGPLLPPRSCCYLFVCRWRPVLFHHVQSHCFGYKCCDILR